MTSFQPGNRWSGFRKTIVFSTALAIWSALIFTGFATLIDYSVAPGPGDPELSIQWPKDSAILLADDEDTLLMFLHPRCPCSRASLRQLERLIAIPNQRVEVIAVFYCPSDQPDDWAHTDLWRAAEKMTRSTPVLDRDGNEARGFGIETSGHTMIFSRSGRRLFSGGITSGRGHEGDSLAFQCAKLFLKGDLTEPKTFPVFGCSIVSVQ